MNFIKLYSQQLLTCRQKILLFGAVSVCVAALFYTYLAAEFITNAILISIADTTAHVRLFIPIERKGEIPGILKQIKQMPETVRADQGIYINKNFYVVSRRQQQELNKPGEVFFSGYKKICVIGYPFDSVDYIPPVLMENVYSKINRERMTRRPQDEPIRIVTDPSEVESKVNWIIINDNLNPLFPHGGSCFGDRFEAFDSEIQSEKKGIILTTAGYLTDNPLSLSLDGSDGNRVYTKIALAQQLAPQEEIKNIIDISISERYQADSIKEKLQKKFSLPEAQSWIEEYASSVPFLKGLKNSVCIGAGAIVLMSIMGIFIVIAMLIIDKKRQLAIVYAMGLKALQLRIIFLVIGIRVAVFSLLLGGGSALLAAYFSLSYWEKVVENFVLIQNASLIYNPVTLAEFALGIFLLCCLASWLPTRTLTLQDPVKNLRSE